MMSFNIAEQVKDFIDSAERELKHRLELEKTIQQLQDEIKSLKNQIPEQKSLIIEKDISSKSMTVDAEDVKILKDMVMSQREELGKKESNIILKQKFIKQYNFIPYRGY